MKWWKAHYGRARRSIALFGESLDYGIWICDVNGRNIYASSSFLKLLGVTQEECSEFGWAAALHPEESEATISAWRECIQEGTFWEREHRFRGADGDWHHTLARGGPIRDARWKHSVLGGDQSRHSRTQRDRKAFAAPGRKPRVANCRANSEVGERQPQTAGLVRQAPADPGRGAPPNCSRAARWRGAVAGGAKHESHHT